MTKKERLYLGSAYSHFRGKFYTTNKSMDSQEALLHLKDYLKFQECIEEILMMGCDDYPI